MHLKDKVIVITGAFGQLGRAVTAEVLRQGAKAALLDISSGDAPDGAHVWRTDLGSLADAEAAMERAAQRFGGIDGLVNVVGGFACRTLEDSDDLSEWQHMYSINLMTCVTASKAVLVHLQQRGSGRIVNIGAAGAARAMAGMGPYASSKSAVARFTEALAEEVKCHEITVNAVLPSIIDTPLNRADMPDADFSNWVTPLDVAHAVGFLLSDAARSITGALLPVTGNV